MTYDVLVYGPLFCDLVFTGLPAMPTPGTEQFAGGLTVAVGGSAIVAAGLHRLGAHVGLIAELGSDPLSQLARQLLDELGLDRGLIREHPHPLQQVTVALSFPQDRAFVTRFQRPPTPPDLAAIVQQSGAAHLHICSFLAVQENPAAAQLAHAAGLTISLDPGWDDSALHDPLLHALTAELDIFLPSRTELCHMARTGDADRAAGRMLHSMRGGIIVMKDGPQGAVLYTQDAEPRRFPALPATPVDTTGAGDAFDAGFLYAYINRMPIEDCMRYGLVCGALATTAPGGTAALPTHTELTQWLSELPS